MIRHVKLTSTRLFLVLALFVPVLAFFISHPAPARASLTQVDSGVIGWDGDKDAAIAHQNGSFDIRAGKNMTASFGVAQNMSQSTRPIRMALVACKDNFHRIHMGDISAIARPITLVMALRACAAATIALRESMTTSL